jgi:hypothetical protein
MKDAAHHLRHIQKKVIRNNRQEELKKIAVSDTHPELSVIEDRTLFSREDSKEQTASSKRLPKLVKAQAYH